MGRLRGRREGGEERSIESGARGGERVQAKEE